MVVGEEVVKVGDSYFQVVFVWQGYDVYVIWLWLVKGGVLYQQDFFLQQEVEYYFLVVMNIEVFGIDFWEYIQCVFWFYVGDVWNIVDKFSGVVVLFIQVFVGDDEFVDVLIVVQCCLDSMLGWYVGVQMY